MPKLDIEKIKRNAVKVKEITCQVAIDDSNDITTAVIGYKNKKGSLYILSIFTYDNIGDKAIIDELRKAIDEKED